MDFPQIGIPFLNHPGITAAHIMPVLLPPDANRVNFMDQMKAQGIQTSIHYPAIHKFTSYKECGDLASARLPITENVADREVTLPLYPAMTNEDVALVVKAILNSLELHAKEVHSH